MQVDSLIHARWIVPVEPQDTVLEQHTLAVQDGRILDLLPQTQARERYQAIHTVELPEHVVIPGLINAHTHAAMSLMRGIADDLPLMDWLQNYIWPLEQRWVSEDFVRAGTELAMAEMLRGGVTCFNDMYFYPEVTARAALSAGMRASVGLILIDFPTAWASNPAEYLQKGVTLYTEMQDETLITTPFAPHAPYTVCNDSLTLMRQQAEQRGMPGQVHMHVHETAQEVADSVEQHGMRPLARLHQQGMLDASLMAVHMTQLDASEIALLAETGTHVIHCPESNLKLASGLCPVADLLAQGVNVALGTDGAASNNDLDLLGEMKTAALLAKGVASDARAVPAHAALRMATLNGARALGLADRMGSLSVGKQADMTAIRLDALETRPLYDPVSHLVYAADRSMVSDVWVDGQRLLNNRQLTTLDVASIKQQLELWTERLQTTTSEPSA